MSYKQVFTYISAIITIVLFSNCSNDSQTTVDEIDFGNEVSIDFNIPDIASSSENTTRAISNIAWEYEINNMIFLYYENGNYKDACFFPENDLPVNSNGFTNINASSSEYFGSTIQAGANNQLYIVCNFTDKTSKPEALEALFGSSDASTYNVNNLKTKLNALLPSNETGIYSSNDFTYGIPMYGIIERLAKFNTCDIKRAIARLQFNASFTGKTVTATIENLNKNLTFLGGATHVASTVASPITLGQIYYIAPRTNTIASSDFNQNRTCIMMKITPGIESSTEYYRIDFWKQSSKEYLDIEANCHYAFNVNNISIKGYKTYDEALSNPGSNINLKDEFSGYQFYNGQYYVRLVYQKTATRKINKYDYKYYTGNYYSLTGTSYTTKELWYAGSSSYLGLGYDTDEYYDFPSLTFDKIRTYTTGLYIETNIPSSISLANFEQQHNYASTKAGVIAGKDNTTNKFENINNNNISDAFMWRIRYFIDSNSKSQIGEITRYPIKLIEREYNFLTNTNYNFTGDMTFSLGNIDYTITLTYPK